MGGARRFSVGAIDGWIIPDGMAFHPPEAIFANAPSVAADEIRHYQSQDGLVRVEHNCVLLRVEDRLVLLDTGLGDLAARFGTPGGNLVPILRDLDISTTDVSTVVISHGHTDHIGGLATLEGDPAPVFSAAAHYLSADEWRVWATEEGLATVPEELAEPARLVLPPIHAAGLLETVDGERDVAPGVRILPAPGHTPGHVAVAITSGKEGALYVADALIHELQLAHTDWTALMDILPGPTVTSRRALLERAVRDGASIIAFHLASWGPIERAGPGFRFVGPSR